MNVFDYFFEDSKSLSKDFIVGSHGTISYRDLYSSSLVLASYFKKNVGEGKHILLISENSIFFIQSYLAILKSGNVCIPIDPQIEEDNLNYIQQQTDCSALVYSHKTKHRFEDNKAFLVLDEKRVYNLIANDSTPKVFPKEFDEARTAEIIFTSGSTGKPKGVMLSHKNLKANTQSIVEYLELRHEDRICVVLPFYYCYGLSLLHTHLRVGGSMVLNNTFLFLGTVIKDLNQFRCTGFAGVPSHYQMLLKKAKSFKETKFPDLRYVTQAGGKLHNVFIKEFVMTFPGINFYVMYGQTEATARLSYLPPGEVLRKIGSIGKAIPNVNLKIMGKNGEALAAGEVGEIVAQGDNVMMGYFQDPGGTSRTLKKGWLYTGDLAFKDEEGFIFVTAREKEIIKVGGKRVSPKEIEELILSIPQVVDCTIKGIEDEILGEALKAFVVVNGNCDVDVIKTQIIKRSKEKLALYKIPQIFEFSNTMSFKATGKK